MRPLLHPALALIAVMLPGIAFAEGDWPRVIPHAGGELTLDAPPQRVVSTAPSLTGILLAIDAPLVATSAAVIGPLTDETGFFLQWSEQAHQRGVEMLYPNLTFDIEALIVSDPDLVVVSATGGDSILPHVAELEAQGLPVLVVDYSTMGWEDQAALLGRATGHEAKASSVIQDFDTRAADAAARMKLPSGDVQIISYNFAGTYAVSRPISAQAKVLQKLGLSVIPLPDVLKPQISRGGDFDFISHEILPQALTAESIFLLNGTPETVQTFLADPVLANVPAVQLGRVYPLGPTSFRVDYYSGLEIIETLTPYFPK